MPFSFASHFAGVAFFLVPRMLLVSLYYHLLDSFLSVAFFQAKSFVASPFLNTSPFAQTTAAMNPQSQLDPPEQIQSLPIPSSGALRNTEDQDASIGLDGITRNLDGTAYTLAPDRSTSGSPDLQPLPMPKPESFNSGEFFEDLTTYIGRKGTLAPIPEIKYPHKAARIRWGFFTTYRRLFSLVFIGNGIALLIVLCSHRTLAAVANATAANLAVCGLIRVPYIVNLFYMAICLIPRTAPLLVRHTAAEIPHFGGVHSGCGVAALFWYISLCGIVTRDFVIKVALLHDTALITLMYLILCLLLFIVIAAYPALRFRFHDRF